MADGERSAVSGAAPHSNASNGFTVIDHNRSLACLVRDNRHNARRPPKTVRLAPTRATPAIVIAHPQSGTAKGKGKGREQDAKQGAKLAWPGAPPAKARNKESCVCLGP